MYARIKFHDPMHPEGDRQVPVRLGMQGHGSVELFVGELSLWKTDTADLPIANDLGWRTLDAVMRHPSVLGVTFRGPWTGERPVPIRRLDGSAR